MARLPQPGSDDGTWGAIINEYLKVSHAPDGSLLKAAIPDGSVTLTKLSQAYIPVSQKSVPGGVATLDGSGKLVASQMPDNAAPAEATSASKGIIQLAGDLGGTADTPIVTGLALKLDASQKGQPSGVATLDGGGKVTVAQIPSLPQYASDVSVVHLSGAETVTGVKNFTASPSAPVPTQPADVATKQYVDSAVVSAVLVPVQTQVFSSAGVVAVDVGTQRLYNDSGEDWTLVNARASVGIAPAGASIIVDIKLNDVTIFAEPADKPAIAEGSLTSGKVSMLGAVTVTSGQYLTVDVNQVGTTTAGSNLTVQLTMQ